MTRDRSETVSQFLVSRRALADAGNVDSVEKLDESLRDIATSDPEAALTIIEELSTSDDFTAREAAAIYAQYLFPTHREQATDLLITLLSDPNPDISRQALHVIDVLTQNPNLNATQAAHRLAEMRTRH